MITEEDQFHFIDLLSLHLKARIDVYGARGLLALIHHMTGLPLPNLAWFPGPVVEMARDHLHAQFPWLRAVEVPEAIRMANWPTFWVWVDVLQRRHATAENEWGGAFRVTPLSPGSIEGNILVNAHPLEVFRWLLRQQLDDEG